MRTLIISGGTVDETFAPEYIKNYAPEYIIAADRGLKFCMDRNLMPDFIVGDFDSLPAGILEKYRQQVPVRTFKPEKDYTDTEIAIYQAISDGATEVMLLGATGTRLDHCIGNIQCLHIFLQHRIPACIVDAHNRITLHAEPFFIDRKEQFGSYISFLPAGDRVEGMTLTGFKYGLKDAVMPNTNSLCISNEIAGERAFVSFTSGEVFMIESRD